MRAMVLAAGLGKRLRPLTDTTPKPNLMVGNKSLIQRNIELLIKNGFDEIIINAKKLNAHIITTEKDYLRLENFNRNEILYVKSSLDISDEKSLTNKLLKLNEKN